MTVKTSKTLVRKCEARTRKGSPCQREAGWGTEHVGTGRCKLHGGRSPSGNKGAARQAAREFLQGWNGLAVPIDPIDAAVKAVELAHGTVEHTREALLDVYLAGGQPTGEQHERYRMALQDLARMTEAANRAGVADRLIAITERMAEQIALAFEEAAQAMKLTPEQRSKGLPVFGAALLRLEDGPALLDAGPE